MDQSKAWVPLRDAIRTLIPSEKWTAVLKLVGGSPDDALASLSGQLAGRLFLDAGIAANSIYAGSERSRIRQFDKLRAEIINCLEARRRSGDLVLKGYTAASPAKPVTISPHLALEYDFVNGTARSGDIRFHGVTVRSRTEEATKAVGWSSHPSVSDSELENFCRSQIATISPAPSMAALWAEAKKNFVGKHVSRDRIRKLHTKLIPALSRKPGPRK